MAGYFVGLEEESCLKLGFGHLYITSELQGGIADRGNGEGLREFREGVAITRLQ